MHILELESKKKKNRASAGAGDRTQPKQMSAIVWNCRGPRAISGAQGLGPRKKVFPDILKRDVGQKIENSVG